jgi:hypothetical protein
MAEGYRIHNGKRWIGGTAATLHIIKKDSGLKKHYVKMLLKMAGDAIYDRNLEEASPFVREIRKKRGTA